MTYNTIEYKPVTHRKDVGISSSNRRRNLLEKFVSYKIYHRLS